MILARGNYLLVVHRRLFETDKSRFFVGKVEDYENGIARVTGFTWVQDTFAGKVFRKEDSRTKILSLASGTLLVYALPDTCDLKSLKFDFDKEGRIWVSDGAQLRMDLTEGRHGKSF